MPSVVRFAKWMFWGAAVFWLPDIAWHAIRGVSFGALDVGCITIVMPLALLVTHRRMRKTTESPRLMGVAFLLGIWILGGFFMTIGSVLLWPGTLGAEGLRGVLMMLCLSPLYTYILMFYDFSLLALFVATLGAAIMAMISFWQAHFRNKRKVALNG